MMSFSETPPPSRSLLPHSIISHFPTHTDFSPTLHTGTIEHTMANKQNNSQTEGKSHLGSLLSCKGASVYMKGRKRAHKTRPMHTHTYGAKGISKLYVWVFSYGVSRKKIRVHNVKRTYANGSLKTSSAVS